VLAIELLSWFVEHRKSIAVCEANATAAHASTSDSDPPGEAAAE
jgi:hypothetical protein